MIKKSFESPDEARTLAHGRVDVVTVKDEVLLRMTFEPGWKWSNDIGSILGEETCHVHHLIYGISGQLKTVMDDGTEFNIVAGDIVDIEPGHDAWVIGDENFVGIDLAGGKGM